MNRRGFISALLKATAGATVAYSFPSIIVPKNIIEPMRLYDVFPQGFGYDFTTKELIPMNALRGIPYLVDNSGDFFGLARGSINLLERRVPLLVTPRSHAHFNVGAKP